MKILIQVSTYSYQTYHFLAKRVKERYPESEFAIIGNNNTKVTDFFKSQNDMQYAHFFEDTSAEKVDVKESVNFDIINNFEKQSDSLVWSIVASDRKVGGAFLHGAYGYGSKYQNNRLYILKKIEKRVTEIENIFSLFRPDIFIPAIAMGSIDVGIYEGMCKIYNTQYAIITLSRVKNYCSFSSNIMLNLDQIDSDTRYLIDNNSQPSKHALELYKNLMDEIESPDYFDSIVHKKPKINIFLFFKIIIFRPFSKVIKSIASSIKHKKFQNLGSIFIGKLHEGVQYITVFKSRFGKVLPKSQKYLLFPLHLNPEYSTLVQGGLLQDQLVIIELLAKSIPSDWIVYVKEHPATIMAKLRPRNFYKKINDIPNVEIAPIDSDVHTIISNSEMVVILTGTSGWEAILRGIPVIAFSDYINVFDALGLSAKVSDLNKLPELISTEVLRIKLISDKERANRVKLFLTAMLNNSFWVTYPKVLFYDAIGTDEEYQICGIELAEGLIEFLPSMFVK